MLYSLRDKLTGIVTNSAFEMGLDGVCRVVGKYSEVTWVSSNPDKYEVYLIGDINRRNIHGQRPALSSIRLNKMIEKLPDSWTIDKAIGEAVCTTYDLQSIIDSFGILKVRRKRILSEEEKLRLTEQLTGARKN